jgi:hypothetical protein
MSRLGTQKREYKTESGRKRRAGSSARDDETGRRRRNETKTGWRLPAALARLDAGRHQSRAVPAGDPAITVVDDKATQPRANSGEIYCTREQRLLLSSIHHLCTSQTTATCSALFKGAMPFQALCIS